MKTASLAKKVFLATLLLLVINFQNLLAQGTPCGDSGDPDVPSTCPLDTWVIALVALALVFVTTRLYRKQQQAIQL